MLERFDSGQAKVVEFSAGAIGLSIGYTLSYTLDEPHRYARHEPYRRDHSASARVERADSASGARFGRARRRRSDARARCPRFPDHVERGGFQRLVGVDCGWSEEHRRAVQPLAGSRRRHSGAGERAPTASPPPWRTWRTWRSRQTLAPDLNTAHTPARRRCALESRRPLTRARRRLERSRAPITTRAAQYKLDVDAGFGVPGPVRKAVTNLVIGAALPDLKRYLESGKYLK